MCCMSWKILAGETGRDAEPRWAAADTAAVCWYRRGVALVCENFANFSNDFFWDKKTKRLKIKVRKTIMPPPDYAVLNLCSTNTFKESHFPGRGNSSRKSSLLGEEMPTNRKKEENPGSPTHLSVQCWSYFLWFAGENFKTLRDCT